MNTQEKADALFRDQIKSWPLLGANWEKRNASRLKKFDFDGFSIQVQCNPKRIVSSAARVDKVSIENRACFLCAGNRPPEEKQIWFGSKYEILCNPFPIFDQHFTIAGAHSPQVIEPEFENFMELSRALPDLVVFYNAAACGASAPDHMHFQAGNRGFLPIETEMERLTHIYGHSILENSEITFTAIDDGLRRFVLLESDNKQRLAEVSRETFRLLRSLQNNSEPMINMLSYYRDGWKILIFPRENHRPWQYFEEGERNILLSPAAVDMGGILITPLEKDFEKITREDIVDIFSQVTCSKGNFNKLTDHLKANVTAYG